MNYSISRSRGRPASSTTRPADFDADLWLRVLIHRVSERVLTGKVPTFAKACLALFNASLLKSVVGGNYAALEIANLTRKKRWLRFRLDEAKGNLVADATGCIFISHQIESASSLHARFSEADKLVRSDPRIRLAWMNLCRQRLGRPTKRPAWGNPWKPMPLHVKADGTFHLG